MNRIQLFIVTLVLMSCNSADKHFIKSAGLEFNAERKKLNLPLLNEDWKLVKNSDGVLQWISSNNNGFISKLVEVKDGRLIREENQFLGEKNYTTVDGTFHEEVFISCFFTDSNTVKSWNCEYNGEGAFMLSITKNQADSILKSWGLNYR